jgi:PBP1b-binding outer membrane lipoprotein LpoB
MKKTLSFLMAGLLVFCLAGCNNENNPETNIDNETNETQVNEPEVNEPEVEENN